MEQDVYAYLVSGWNDSVERAGQACAVTEFYAMLMNVYEGIHRWTVGMPEGAMNEIVRRWGAMPASLPNPLFADIAAPADDVWRSAIAELRQRIRESASWFVESTELVAAAV